MINSTQLPAPTPMAGQDQPVDWMFAYKFNAASFPGCSANCLTPLSGTPGIFGGLVDDYPNGHSQQYVFASSANPTLVQGNECLGATLVDPLGATFAQIYDNPGYYYVLWNDQFINDPIPNGDSPWGHSKGLAAWNDDGEGFVLQVSTPSWPGSGSCAYPRKAGNTLGCISDDDDIEVAQHFFALKINRDDLAAVLNAIGNASVCTKVTEPQIVNNGGPSDIQALVNHLGQVSNRTQVTMATLSSGVQLISKPSLLAVPPWQLVSAKLNRLDLRVASWWTKPEIYSTEAGVVPQCWADGLGTPGAVEIATTGVWQGITLGLKGDEEQQSNHAKIGISKDPSNPLCIFGDMNQQGALAPDYAYKGQRCNSSQNGRGGVFFALKNQELFQSLTQLLAGETAPDSAPANRLPTSHPDLRMAPAG